MVQQEANKKKRKKTERSPTSIPRYL